MEQRIIYVGLDVHKDTIAVALAEAGKRGELREHGKIANTPAALRTPAAKLASHGWRLRFCYEAGPCGYGSAAIFFSSKMSPAAFTMHTLTVSRDTSRPAKHSIFLSLGCHTECQDSRLGSTARLLPLCRLGLDGDVPDHSTFSKNRHGRFRESDALRRLFESVVGRCMKEGIVGARPSRSTPASSWPTPIAGEASPRSRTSIRRPVGQSRNIFRCWMTRPLAGRRRSSPRRFRRPIRRPATPLQPTLSPVMPTPTIISSI